MYFLERNVLRKNPGGERFSVFPAVYQDFPKLFFRNFAGLLKLRALGGTASKGRCFLLIERIGISGRRQNQKEHQG
jgi:hypothetical protein